MFISSKSVFESWKGSFFSKLGHCYRTKCFHCNLRRCLKQIILTKHGYFGYNPANCTNTAHLQEKRSLPCSGSAVVPLGHWLSLFLRERAAGIGPSAGPDTRERQPEGALTAPPSLRRTARRPRCSVKAVPTLRRPFALRPPEAAAITSAQTRGRGDKVHARPNTAETPQRPAVAIHGRTRRAGNSRRLTSLLGTTAPRPATDTPPRPCALAGTNSPSLHAN